MAYRIPLCKPIFSARAEEMVLDVLRSGAISYGRYSKRFEDALSALHGCSHGVLSNSGTSSLQVALAALKEAHNWKGGDEVLVPATTFVATANVVLMNGLKPVFVDIEDQTYGMDPDLIEKAITPRTRAIIAVHLFGIPCQIERIAAIAKKRGLRLIEDSCETACASVNGKSVGSFGDVGCFSFYACHQVNAGIGGMGITNDNHLAVLMRSLVNHGRDPSFINGMVSKAAPDKKFLFERLGFSYRVTEMEAALGLEQTERLPYTTAKRTYAGIRLYHALQREFGDMLHIPPMTGSSYMMFPVVLSESAIVGKLWAMQEFEDSGVETREMLPLLSQPFYQKMGHNIADFPVSKRVKDRGFYFGIYPEMDAKDIHYIVETFRKVLCKKEARA